jgi:hypothetical protein
MVMVTTFCIAATVKATEKDVELKLNSNDGSTSFQIQDSKRKRIVDIDSSGNVYAEGTLTVAGKGTSSIQGALGIGTSDPVCKLDVIGDQIRLKNDKIDHWLSITTDINLYKFFGFEAKGNDLWIDAIKDKHILLNKRSKGNVIMSTGGGKVGIGTVEPKYKLHVNGDIAIGDLSEDRHIRIADSAGNLDRVFLRTVNKNDIHLGDIDNNNGNVFIYAAGSNAVSILGTGSVGIGTQEPETKFHLIGNAIIENSAPELTIHRTNNQKPARILFRNFEGNYIVSIHTTDTKDGDLIFRVGANKKKADDLPAILILHNSSGNVGIGETSPRAKLSVAGGAAFGKAYSTTHVSDGNVIISGKVGIGTSDPDFKLDVRGSINAEKTLHADSVQAKNDLSAKNITARESLASENISATNVSAGNISADNIAATKEISATNVAADNITAEKGVSATNISADSITAHQGISANSVTANNITAQKGLSATNVSADKVAAKNVLASDSMSANNISVKKNISTANLSAGEISAKKLDATSISATNIDGGTVFSRERFVWKTKKTATETEWATGGFEVTKTKSDMKEQTPLPEKYPKDYVFEPDYKLESIEEHAQFMWENKRLPAMPKIKIEQNGEYEVDLILHLGGILEELEKAHIYIEQLNTRLKTQEQEIQKLKVKIEELLSKY